MAGSLPFVTAGFEEVEHTAEWAYRVWARTVEELFVQAAIGLYALAGVQLEAEPPCERMVELEAMDTVSLLVAWLNELLYLFESEGLGFKRFHVRQLNTHALRIQAIGAPVHSWQKYIKAATYSNLSIQTTATGVETTIVLDV